MSETIQDNIAADEDAIERVRAEVRRMARGRPNTVIAKEADVAYGTFSAWMAGKYAGDNARVAGEVQKWLDGQATKIAVRATSVAAPAFIETRTAQAFISALQTAQYEPDFVLIAGAAGVGKTTSSRHYQATNPNVTILTCEPCFTTPRMVLDRLAEELGVTEKYSSHTVSRAIQRRLRGSGGLLIVDEVNHLTTNTIDQLRTIYDLTDVGIALVGNEVVYSRIEGYSRQAHFAQLYRRVGMRVNREGPHPHDIAQMIDAWGVTDAAQRAVLAAIGRQPGALGNISKTMKRAHMLAGGEALSADLLRRAWQAISAKKITVGEAA